MAKRIQVDPEIDCQPPPYELTVKSNCEMGGATKFAELQQLWSQHSDESISRRSPFQSAIGVSLAAVAGFLFGLTTIFINLAESGGGSSIQVLFLQNIFCVLMVTPVIYCCKLPVLDYRKPEKGLMVLNAMTETTGRITLYFAFRYGLAGNVSSITFGALPVITPLFAGLCLGEKWKLVDAINSIFNIVGIILIAGPSFIFSEAAKDDDTSAKDVALSTLLSLLTAVSFSVSAVSIHALPRVPIFVILLYSGTIGPWFHFRPFSSPVLSPGILAYKSFPSSSRSRSVTRWARCASSRPCTWRAPPRWYCSPTCRSALPTWVTSWFLETLSRFGTSSEVYLY
ncbi:solute carrier family 35 member G1-like [Ptychodera flava]|uniref:solute carrier family 35 member G1-like n=1 Tax=Ptychodera flava TaxID=63121 RepID=UPI00396A7CAA